MANHFLRLDDDIYRLLGNLRFIDNEKVYFGTGDDAEIYYDGTNLVIDPAAVGAGVLSILTDVNLGANDLTTTGILKVGQIDDSSDRLSIDPNNRYLVDSGGSIIFNWETHTLYDTLGVSSIDTDNRYLYNSAGNVALDWSTDGTLDFVANDLTTTGTGTFDSIVETNPTLFKLDQTIPQTVINGVPTIEEGLTINGLLTLDCETELFIELDNTKAYAGLVSNLENTIDRFDTITGQIIYSIGMNMDNNCDGVVDKYKDGNASFSIAHRFYQGSNRSFEGDYDIDTIVGGIVGACSNSNDIDASGKTLSAVNFGFFSDVVFDGASTNGTHNVNNVLISGTLESKDHNVTSGTVRNIMLWVYDDLGLGIDTDPTFIPKAGDENYVILNESVYPIVMRKDNSKMIFGAGDDAEIYYDGTNFVIDPKVVGSGFLEVLGDIRTETGTGTSFFTGEFDFAPTLAPGAIVLPTINFTNSNAIGLSPYLGAIRGGLLAYAHDGYDAEIVLVHDFETGQYANLGYNSTDSTLELAVNGESSRVIFSNVNDGTDSIPVIGGRTSADDVGLVFDTSIILWDKAGLGNVYISSASQDLSVTSIILNWSSVTETLSYVGAGGIKSIGSGTGGTTVTPYTLAYKAIGIGTDNDGLRLKFEHRTDAGVGIAYTAGYIDCIQTDASSGTMDSYLAFGGYTDGSSEQWLKLDGLLGTFNTDIKVITGTNTNIETDELYVDLDSILEDYAWYVPVIKGKAYETLEVFGLTSALGINDRLLLIDKADVDRIGIIFSKTDLFLTSDVGQIDYDFTDSRFEIVGDWCPDADDYADDIYHNIGVSGLEWDNLHLLDGIHSVDDLTLYCPSEKTLVLDTAVWDDIQFATATGKVPAANFPDFDTFTTNTKEYKFDVDDYIDLEANEMAHWWKEGTTVYPHVHVALNGANASGSTQYAKFTISFAYADTSEVWTETSDTIEVAIPTGSADLKHILGSGTGVALTNNLIGTQVKIRLKRIAATSGTEYPNHIFVTQTGLHAEKDTLGSRTIAAK